MARPQKRVAASQLSPGQAAYVVERLLKDRRVSASEINRYVGEMGQEISELERRLQALYQANGRTGRTAAAAPAARVREAGETAAPAKRKRKAKITKEQLASRQLQGRYLALVRRLPANKRVQMAKIAKEKGREAAIKEMQDVVKK